MIAPVRALAMGIFLLASASRALAWGDEGHEIVALVARHFMRADVVARVDAMLTADTGTLTAHDMAAEATWADKFRDANVNGAKLATGQWHFVDIELADGNEDAACFGHPALPAGSPAYPSTPDDCVVDKVQQFQGELADPKTPEAERLNALRFVLHFVGDMHQPLHASDDHDRGGNDKLLAGVAGSRNLHAFWDTAAVERLGTDAAEVAARLAGGITSAQQAAWSAGTPASWALEAFALVKSDAYGQLPAPSSAGAYRLTAAYQTMAAQDAALQLSKAGVRLAATLNAALGGG